MEIPLSQLPPGDPRLVDVIVGQLKSKGIFDKLRKECLADVDTKPAFLNLRQRVDGQVKKFLTTKTWKNDMNKNHLRDGVRKNIQESGILDSGIDAIINQVVNPKIKTLILPYVEDTVYAFLHIEKPKREIKDYDYEFQTFTEPPPAYVHEVPPPEIYPSYDVPPPSFIKKEETSDSLKTSVSLPEKTEPAASSESDISVGGKSPEDETLPIPQSEVLPMETDAISSGEDDILARTSPNPAQMTSADDVKMEEDNAVDSFDTARGKTDEVMCGVEKLQIKDDITSAVDSADTKDKEVSKTSTGPLFDNRSLDSISSNSSGLSFSPLSEKKESHCDDLHVASKDPDNIKSLDELRSTQSTPLIDEKSPLNESVSSSDNSKTWAPYTLPKDLSSKQRITIASFGPASSSNEPGTVLEGASPVSTENSQDSLGNTSVSKESSTTQTEESQDSKSKTVKSEKSEGEISSSSSSSPEPSTHSRDKSGYRDSHSSRHRSHSRDTDKHHSFKSRDDKHRSKEQHHSKNKSDDHSSHRDKDKQHRRDKDDDKDRDKHSSRGHHHSHEVTSSAGTTSVKSSDSKDKREKSGDHHKSHSSSYSHSKHSSSKGSSKHERSRHRSKSSGEKRERRYSKDESKSCIDSGVSDKYKILSSKHKSDTERKSDKSDSKKRTSEKEILKDKESSLLNRLVTKKNDVLPRTTSQKEGIRSDTSKIAKSKDETDKKTDPKTKECKLRVNAKTDYKTVKGSDTTRLNVTEKVKCKEEKELKSKLSRDEKLNDKADKLSKSLLNTENGPLSVKLNVAMNALKTEEEFSEAKNNERQAKELLVSGALNKHSGTGVIIKKDKGKGSAYSVKQLNNEIKNGEIRSGRRSIPNNKKHLAKGKAGIKTKSPPKVNKVKVLTPRKKIIISYTSSSNADSSDDECLRERKQQKISAATRLRSAGKPQPVVCSSDTSTEPDNLVLKKVTIPVFSFTEPPAELDREKVSRKRLENSMPKKRKAKLAKKITDDLFGDSSDGEFTFEGFQSTPLFLPLPKRKKAKTLFLGFQDDTDNDSSDMEVSILQFCDMMKYNDFEGFAETGCLKEISNTDQKLNYLLKYNMRASACADKYYLDSSDEDAEAVTTVFSATRSSCVTDEIFAGSSGNTTTFASSSSNTTTFASSSSTIPIVAIVANEGSDESNNSSVEVVSDTKILTEEESNESVVSAIERTENTVSDSGILGVNVQSVTASTEIIDDSHSGDSNSYYIPKKHFSSNHKQPMNPSTESGKRKFSESSNSSCTSIPPISRKRRILNAVQSEIEGNMTKDNVILHSYALLTPEEDRSSSKDYDVDLSQGVTSYSPLSPASDSSADVIVKKSSDTCRETLVDP